MAAPNRVGTETYNGSSGDPVTYSHTTTSATDLLTVAIAANGSEDILGVTFDGASLTLIHATTPSGNNRDTQVAIYGIVSPGAKTATISIDFGNSASCRSKCVNWTDVDTTSVAAATNYIDDWVANAGSSVSVLTSGGTSGNTLYAVGNHVTASSASWASAAFNEIAEHSALFVDAEYTTLPAGTTITWSSADENAAVLIELVAAGAAAIGATKAGTLALMGVGI